MVNQSARFYDRFASRYDLLISDRRYDEDLPFFNGVFARHKVKSVLDCSCGTGKLVARLSQVGFEATGSDISAEMIDIARRNAETSGVEAQFVQADFKRLSEALGKKYDCVICWGNSLSHELEERGIRRALRSMSDVLRKKGVVVIQVRNLPKWVREGRRIIPMHYHKEPNGDRKVFIYVLDFHRTRVTFNVISYLEFNEKPTLEADSVDYRIVSARRLKEMMAASGFSGLKTYGDRNFGRFSEASSDHIIVVGTK